MKYLVFPFGLLSLLLGFMFSDFRQQLTRPDTKPAGIAICGPAENSDIKKMSNGKFVIPLPGWGNYSYPISSKNDSARFYFNQGLTMYYSYHMKEATASFKEASRFDPGNAMTYWGQALTMGPYYNAAHGYSVPDAIKGVLSEMNMHMATATEKEMRLIKAMNSRYPSDFEPGKTKALDKEYAAELKNLVKLYPADADIKMQYIDAVMLMHAWDFWQQDGSAKSWTPEVVKMCEEVLKANPEHPAALHYYIHLTEASRNPEVALANAAKLEKLLPDVAHMVHMASHEYQRNGLFVKGVEVNDKADDNLMNYESAAKNLALNKHSPHYFAVQTYCALSGGMYQTGMKNAMRCRKSVSPSAENTYDQYLFMLPVMTLVRLGKWEQILQDSVVPDNSWSYALVLHHFAKGLAHINNGNAKLASGQLSLLRKYAQDPLLRNRRIPFNSPLQMAGIADAILNGTILFDLKKNNQAVLSFMRAIEIEDELIYTEPNDWPVPARQILGAYLLRSGKIAEAEKIYREDMAVNPENGWSSIGMYQSAKAGNRQKDMAVYEAKYRKAFEGADEIPTLSFYIPNGK